MSMTVSEGVPGLALAAIVDGGLVTVMVASAAVVGSIPLLVFALWPRGRAAAKVKAKPGSHYRQNELRTSFADRLVLPIVQDVAHYARRVTPQGVINASADQLAIAGLAGSRVLEAILSLKVLFSLAGGIGAFVGLASVTMVSRLAFAVGAGLVGFALPDLYVRRRASARRETISRSLPDVLDQLAVIIEAGLGFDAALSRIVQSSSGPLIDEFARALQSMRLGKSRSESLQKIAERTDVVEVRQFVGAIKQADSLGVPVARVVRTQADHMRQLKRLAAEEKAMRLPVKLTLPMVLCMLPSLFIVLIGPVVIRAMQSL